MAVGEGVEVSAPWMTVALGVWEGGGVSVGIGVLVGVAEAGDAVTSANGGAGDGVQPARATRTRTRMGRAMLGTGLTGSFGTCGAA